MEQLERLLETLPFAYPRASVYMPYEEDNPPPPPRRRRTTRTRRPARRRWRAVDLAAAGQPAGNAGDPDSDSEPAAD